MKTSVIEVKEMLSVLSIVGVEKIIGKVPGVESVTVNYAAGSATVRYDETQIKSSEIKAAVHQSGVQSEDEGNSKPGDKLKPEHKHSEVPKPEASAAPASSAIPIAKPAEEKIKAPVMPKPSVSPTVKSPEEKEK